MRWLIKPGTKVGVVGRTGAGKSTIAMAVTRMIELCDGKILIDGKNIRDVCIEQLRGAITVITQDPVLFNGTLRYNLDPCHEYQETKIVSLLQDAGLDEICKREGSTSILDFKISENGTNLSVGEK